MSSRKLFSIFSNSYTITFSSFDHTIPVPIFAHLAIGESQRLQGSCRVWGYPVSVEALRLPDNSLLIVIGHPDSQGLIHDYALRWGIETLFGIFKTRGFCLESTHFTDFSFGLVSQNWSSNSSSSSHSPQETWSPSAESFSSWF